MSPITGIILALLAWLGASFPIAVVVSRRLRGATGTLTEAGLARIGAGDVVLGGPASRDDRGPRFADQGVA